MKSIINSFIFIGTLLLTMMSSQVSTAQTRTSDVSIADPTYIDLTEEFLGYVETFDFDKWYGMMSDDVIYYFPDGDEGTRSTLEGKKAVMEFWDNYQSTSGNTKLIITKPSYIPLNIDVKQEYSKVTGALVIAYFSAEFHYGTEKTNIRMNWSMHFNQDKLVDRVFTYYDRTPIIEAVKRNYLTKG